MLCDCLEVLDWSKTPSNGVKQVAGKLCRDRIADRPYVPRPGPETTIRWWEELELEPRHALEHPIACHLRSDPIHFRSSRSEPVCIHDLKGEEHHDRREAPRAMEHDPNQWECLDPIRPGEGDAIREPIRGGARSDDGDPTWRVCHDPSWGRRLLTIRRR